MRYGQELYHSTNIEHVLSRAVNQAHTDWDRYRQVMKQIAGSPLPELEKRQQCRAVLAEIRSYKLVIKRYAADYAEMWIDLRYGIVVWKRLPPPDLSSPVRPDRTTKAASEAPAATSQPAGTRMPVPDPV